MKYQPCIMLPIALILLGAGVICLLFFGLSNIEPYTVTKDFKTAHCIVVRSNITDQRNCRVSTVDKAETSGKASNNTSISEQEVEEMNNKTMPRSLPPTYPCLKVLVNYTEKYFEAVDESMVDKRPEYDKGPIILHDTHATWLKLQEEVALGLHNSTCTLQICSSDSDRNSREVAKFQASYGDPGTTFKCYYDPKDRSHLFLYIVTGSKVIHMILWPSLALSFGIFILVVVIFQWCEIWICRKVLTNSGKTSIDSQGKGYKLASRTDSDRSAASTASMLRDRYSDSGSGVRGSAVL